MAVAVADCIAGVESRLAEAGNPSAGAEARLMAWYLLDASPTDMALNPDAVLDAFQIESIDDAVERRIAGEPLQYICGRAPFRYADILCREGVFIPRPETEMLVDLALEAVDSILLSGEPLATGQGGDVIVCDLCCGTGAVAASIASERMHVRCHAGDISPDAVALTRENVSALHVDGKVDVGEGDLFAPFDGLEFHVVVSNPPYIPTAKLAHMPGEVVDWEPREALDGGEDGLDTFRRIVAGCADHLLPGGYLVCELDEDTLDAAARICRESAVPAFSSVEVVRDLAGRDRFVRARRAKPGDEERETGR